MFAKDGICRQFEEVPSRVSILVGMPQPEELGLGDGDPGYYADRPHDPEWDDEMDAIFRDQSRPHIHYPERDPRDTCPTCIDAWEFRVDAPLTLVFFRITPGAAPDEVLGTIMLNGGVVTGTGCGMDWAEDIWVYAPGRRRLGTADGEEWIEALRSEVGRRGSYYAV